MLADVTAAGDGDDALAAGARVAQDDGAGGGRDGVDDGGSGVRVRWGGALDGLRAGEERESWWTRVDGSQWRTRAAPASRSLSGRSSEVPAQLCKYGTRSSDGVLLHHAPNFVAKPLSPIARYLDDGAESLLLL